MIPELNLRYRTTTLGKPTTKKIEGSLCLKNGMFIGSSLKFTGSPLGEFD